MSVPSLPSRIISWWRLPSAPGVWIALALTSIFALAAALPLTPHDLWLHVRLGQVMLAQRGLVTHDLFSYTQAGRPYYNNAWLSELALYWLWTAGGAPLLTLVRALAVTFFYAVAASLGWRAGGGERLTAFLILVAGLASFPHWQLRPQTFALPLFALFSWILAAHTSGRRAHLFLLALLMLAWVNLHGSFLLGLLLAALTLLGETVTFFYRRATLASPLRLRSAASLRSLGICTGLTFAAILANPLGPGLLAVVSDVGSDPSIQGWVLEWLPPNIREFPALVFFALIVALLFSLAYSPRRLTPTEWLVAAAFIWLGWSAYRSVLWAALLLIPLLATQWSALFAAARARWPQLVARLAGSPYLRPHPFPALRALLLATLLALFLSTFPLIRQYYAGTELQTWVSADTPVQAAAYLLSNPLHGHLFHEIGAGSYLMWALWPQGQVFVDARINLYPASQWQDYFAVTNASDGFGSILTRYDITYLLVDSFWQKPLLQALEKRPSEYHLLYRGGESYLFERVVQAPPQ